MSADFETQSFRAAWEELEWVFAYFQQSLKEVEKNVQPILCCQKNQVSHCFFEGNDPGKKSQKSSERSHQQLSLPMR